MNDIVISKIASLQRCVQRARQEYAASAGHFADDLTHQDAALLNVTRACELVIDLANHAIKLRRLGIPADSRESFARLAQAGLVEAPLAATMQSMVGFRNIAIHDYQRLDLTIAEQVISRGLDDLLAFAETIRLALDPGADTPPG